MDKPDHADSEDRPQNVLPQSTCCLLVAHAARGGHRPQDRHQNNRDDRTVLEERNHVDTGHVHREEHDSGRNRRLLHDLLVEVRIIRRQ